MMKKIKRKSLKISFIQIKMVNEIGSIFESTGELRIPEPGDLFLRGSKIMKCVKPFIDNEKLFIMEKTN